MNDRTLMWLLGGAVGAGVLYALTRSEDNVINTLLEPSAEQLADAANTTLVLAQQALPSVIAGARRANINSRDRWAMWIAQTAHETGGYHYMRELWGPTAQQLRYENSTLAGKLGNTEAGDGYRFRGRGLIQLTGRANYQKAGTALGLDLITDPDQAALAPGAGLVAAWYWNTHNLNGYADARDVVGASGVINVGNANADPAKINGLENRQALYASSQDNLPSGAA